MSSHDQHRVARLQRLLGQRRAQRLTDLGQTAIVAVLAVTLIIGVIGGVLVASVVQSAPLQAQTQVTVLAHRALQAGENAYVTAINANPTLAQCNTNTSSAASGQCSGINYGIWNKVPNSDANNGNAEWYEFGNPQPSFDPTTNTLTNLAVQVVGAAGNPSTANNYVFDSENINLASTNGFLNNVWWSNYESYSQTGDYSTCNYNWSSAIGYGAGNNNGDGGCGPVYFAAGDYLFGPTYTNDSVFVSNDGTNPTFGNPTGPFGAVASTVTTADPNCLFVDGNNGMDGSASGCTAANSDVALYDTTNSKFGQTVQPPPQSNAQLATVASQYGCLYNGPTQISLTTSADPITGKNVTTMNVTSPETSETPGLPNAWDNYNIPSNHNNCPNNGSAPLPTNGVVYVQNYTATTVSGATGGTLTTGANPFDGYIANSVTNITSSKAPTVAARTGVTLTANVTSSVNQIGSGSTITFSQTTGGSTQSISGCVNLPITGTAVQGGTSQNPTYTMTATCTYTTGNSTTTAFSAAFSGGTYTNSSQGNYGQTNTLTPGVTYGANSQTTAGGCTACYYGEASNPDTEGDAFVNGNLAGQLTIGTQNNVVVDGNLTYADCSNKWTQGQSGLTDNCLLPSRSNDSLGLIANKYVEVNHPVTSVNGSVLASCNGTPGALCDAATPNGAFLTSTSSQAGVTIDAAILALTQSFVVNNYGTGGAEGKLAVYGSVQQFGRGPVGTFSGSGVASGYSKNYTWDPLLDYLSPPSYLVPSTAPWDLMSVGASAGEHPTSVCPALTGVYNPTTKVAGTSITGSCSQATGGLPGYPASTAPSPPLNVIASAAVGGVANVSWTQPAYTGPIGHGINRYNVVVTPQCSGCTGLSTTGATTTPITGLTPGINYSFQVSATNDYGTSDLSLASSSITAPNVPYPPTNVSAVGNSNDTVTVSWTDPSSVGSPIVHYTVTASPGGATCTANGATATSCTFSGLTVGSTYTFTVTATNGLGTSPSSQPSNAVQVPTLPGAPLSVTATSFANTQSVISWSPPSSNGGLTITQYRVTSSPGARTCTTAGATTCTVTGLTNGTPYTFTVTATNAIGTGPSSAASGAATPATVPGAPTIGTATAANGSATVAFTAPASNGGAAITSYTATAYLTTTGATTGITGTCTSSPCIISGLTNATSYKFKVVANNGAGAGTASAFSGSVTPTGPPGAPTNVTATSYANSQSVVSWTAPPTGGSAITGYTVTSSPGSKTCTTTGATSCTVTGLTNGTPYTFTVTATNALGVGPASAPSAAATPGTVPGAPTGVTAVTGYQQGTVSWSAPASNGGLPITGYTVTSSTGGKTCTTSTTSCIVTGLTNGVTYTFTVTATNAAGTGAASSASNSIVPATTVPNPPTNVTATAFQNAQSAITWTAPTYTGGGTINQYVVTSSPGAKTCTSTTTSCTVTGLTNGTTYTFTVTAAHTATAPTGPSAASAPSSAIIPSTVPGAPTGATATTHANAQSVVSWTAPASNGAPITGYTVTSVSGGKTCTVGTVTGVNSSTPAYTGALNCTVTGLTNGTSYTFTVTATNGSGTSAASAASATIVPATIPGAPTGVTATSNANTQSVVSWTAPASNGGLAITGYTVTSSPGSKTCTTTGATSCTVTGLSNGIPYTFTVTATNPIGTGPASTASAPAIPSGPPTAPLNVRGASGQNASSVVTWTPPADNGGSPIIHYTVTSSGGQTCTTANGTTLTCTVTGLTNGTAYTFTVTATNGFGTGPASAASNSVTPASAPGAPTGVTAVNVPNVAFGAAPQVQVSWVAPVATGGSAISSYTVTANNGGGTCTTGNGTTTNCLFQGLVAGTSYTFTVAATNTVGTGPASAPATVTASTVPAAPSGVVGTDVANIAYLANPQVTVTWTAPSTGGAPISGYTVTASNGATCTSAIASCTFTSGLTAGTSYTFKVTATNVSGTGSPSPSSSSVTAATVPQAPTIGSATYTTGIAFGSPPQVKVTWTPPANNGGLGISGYTVTSSPAGGTCTVSGAAATNCTITTGLTAGTPYTFSVKATNTIGSSSASGNTAAITPATVPQAPTGVTAVNVANTPYGTAPAVTVAWTASANGGSAVTNYAVTASPGGGTCSTATTTCNVTGLTAGTAYTFTVVPTNAAGTGLGTTSAAMTAATVPQNPTIGSATYVTGIAYGAQPQVAVTWVDPANNGSAAITGYTVTSSSGQTCTVAGATATTCTVSTGLTAGAAYTFSVKATNSVGSSTASANSNSVTPATVPQAPTIGSVSYTPGIAFGSPPQVVVNWAVPANNGGAAITTYSVTSSPAGGSCTAAGPSGTTCTISSGLAAGTAYTFAVTATNAAGTSVPSANSSSLTPATVPATPTAPTATNVANQPYAGTPSALVSWSAPATGGASISGYTVTASPGGATCGATGTSCTVTGLTAGTAYTFTVKATNAAGTSSTSPASNSITAATVPQNPTIGSATVTTNIAFGSNPQVAVTWTDPANNGGSAITGYTVTSSPSGGTCTVAGASATTCTITSGLTAGTSYTFTATATNSAGTSLASSATTAVTPATASNAPTGVTASNVAGIAFGNNPNAKITWVDPTNNGGSTITGYTVTANTGGGTCTVAGAAATTCTITSNLTAGSAYTFTVTATNGVATSAASTASASLTPATVPQAPTIGSASYTAGAAYGAAVSVPVTWSVPASNGGSAITGYTVTSSPAGGTCTVAGATATTCTITTGLTAGTAYTFSAVATNAAGSSQSSGASNSITPATVPQAPTIGSVAYVPGIAYGSAPQVTVNWTANATGGSAITSFTATASPGGATCSSAGTSCTVTTGLTAGTAYSFTVKATNASGTSTASAASASVTPATVPQNPTIGTATNVAGVPFTSSPQVSVAWTAGASGGSSITGFTVTSSPTGGTCTSAGTSCTITSGLTAGTAYTFSVVANNAAGTSTSSANSNSVIPATVPQAPTIGSASYTTGITFGSNPQVPVTWVDPAGNGGSAITGYTVTSSPAGGTCTVAGASATTCTVTSGLTAGTAYTFSVVATNASGSSLASAASNSVTPATLPSVPTGVSATNVVGVAFGGTPQANVTWTASSNGGTSISGYTVTSSPGGLTCTTATTTCTVSGLTAGTTYSYTVTATNAAGTSAASAASTAVAAATVPQAPTIGSAAYVTNIANGANPQVTVNWVDPAGNGGSAITGYTVTASSGSGTCTVAGATATTCTITANLTAGTAYTFTVKATNAAGNSLLSSASNSVTPATVAGAPTIGTATPVTGLPNGSNPQVNVTWTDPASNGGTAITGYTVTASPGGTTCAAAGATATSCSFTSGLTAGTSYTFTVTATNAAGTSLASGATSSVTPATVPAAPTAVTGSNVAGIAFGSNPQIAVSWTPGSNGGSTVSAYTVSASPGTGTCTTAGTTCTITSGLTAGTAYTFTVTATNAAGTSPASAASSAVTAATVAGTPTSPTATVVTGIANGANPQVTVNWVDPAGNGGSAITGYTVTASSGTGTCTATGAAATTCTITSNLTAGTAYTFTVKANNGAGASAGATSTSVTPATVAGAPTIGTTTVVAGIANGSSPQAVVNWTVPASNGGTTITGYTVTANTGGGTCTVSGAASTTCTVSSNLTAGSAYTFTVTATNAVGTSTPSAASNSVTPATLAAVPTGVSGTSNANASSVVSWTASANNGGSAITSYTVTSSPGGFTCTTATTSCTVSGLTNGTSYTFTVKATNGEGTTAASSPSATVIPATTPGAPTAVSATSFGNQQSVVSWTAPSNGGSNITNYTVTSSPGGFTCNTSTTSCTVAGLTNGTAYTFTVTATNGVGTGPASAASSAATPATVPNAPIIGLATSVGGVAYGSTPDAAITWTDPTVNGGAAITGYTVTSSPAGGTCTATGATATTCTVTTGLTAGTAYTFTVTATNAAGTSASSAASNSITASTLPNAPTAVAGTSNVDSSSVVSWTAPANGGSAITNYTVTATDHTTPANGGQTASNGASPATVTGLTNGDSYTFTVTATNGSGTGAASAASATVVPAAAPSVPTGVTAAATSASTTATVAWTASASNGATVSYTITPYVAGVAKTPQVFGTATTDVVTGLTKGTTYTFTVKAINSAGTSAESVASNSIIIGTPGSPTAVAATSNANAQSVVSWTAPTVTGGTAISSYTVTSSPGNKTCTTANGTTLTCTVTTLTNGTAYTFTVTANNSVGVGVPSAPSAAATPATAPGAPTGVSATSNEDSQSTVSYTAPASDGGATISGYTITATDSTTPANGGQSVADSGSPTVVTGLTNGDSYTFTVTATNAAGTSPASTASAAAVPAAVPDAPTGVTAAATSSATTATIAWTAPFNEGSAITGYTITPFLAGVAKTPQVFGTSATTDTVTGLTSGGVYTFTVAATNGLGTGSASAASNSLTTGRPGAPTGVTAAATTSTTTATITWVDPTTTGGSAITGYTVTGTNVANGTNATTPAACSTSLNGASTSCTFTGLTIRTTYTFTVTAKNANGLGNASVPSNSITLGAPGSPTGVAAIATSSATTASVSWTAAAINPAAATGYTVTPYLAGVAGTPQVFNNTATTETVTGLTAGGVYTFTVSGVNANGTGVPSAQSAPLTLGLPGAPTGVSGTAGHNTFSVVSWTAAPTGGSAITGYTVTPYLSGVAQTPQVFGTGVSQTVTGLTNNGSYTFTVTATNANGSGPASAPSAVVVP